MKSSLDLTRLATVAATAAAEHLRAAERPRDPATWAVKAHHDFVTRFDRECEAIIAGILLKGEPGSTILGEEFTPNATREGLVWIVDPIDGTTNFAHGFPCYAVSIAAEVDGVLEAGVVLEVPANRLYYGWRNGGAWLDEARLQVSRIEAPGHALIGTGYPFKHPEDLPRYQAQFARIASRTSGIRRAGSAALDLCWVAAGAFDGFWELRLAPWDMAAGLLLVREAGGIATDLAGHHLAPADSGLVAGSPAIHRWLMQVIHDDSAS